MVENLEVFDGPDFGIKLATDLATKNFEFATSLQTNKKSAPVSTEEESQSPFKVDSSLQQDQSNFVEFSNAPINFGVVSQLDRISASPTIAKTPEESASSSRTSEFSAPVSDASLAKASPIYKVGKVKKTGNIQIDSLFYGDKIDAAKITYSFFDGGYYDGTKDEKNVKEITGKMKSYLRDILENLIEPLINVDFVEVSDKGDNFGQIRYMFSDGPDYAYAYSPENGSWWEGDVHLDPKSTRDWNAGPGSYGYETLIHETLHTLGLKHPGNYNGNGKGDPPFLPNHLDTNANTVMTYNDDNKYAVTLMPYDIRALQYMYGAKEHAAGDTAYKFETVYGYTVGGDFFGSKTRSIKQTIWDNAGKDTFDFTQLAFNKSGYHFDLSEGGWITTQKDYESSSFKADGNGKRYKTTSIGSRTAYNVVIENVVNSTSDDRIYLNQAANTISGYTVGRQVGDDILFNTDGKDILDLSSYKSSDVTRTESGGDLVLNLGGDGSITIKEYLTAIKENQIKILFDGATPGPVDPPVDPSTPPKTINGTSSVDNLSGTQEKDIIKGHDGDDILIGRKGNDELLGGRGADTLRGGQGNDTLKGSYGNDILVGGLGYDKLSGGKGDDAFVFNSIDDRRDVITDFGKGGDTIDLQAVLAGNEYASLDAFKDYVKLVQSGANTKVQVDALGDNGDQFRTLAILNNVTATDLTAAQFRV